MVIIRRKISLVRRKPLVANLNTTTQQWIFPSQQHASSLSTFPAMPRRKAWKKGASPPAYAPTPLLRCRPTPSALPWRCLLALHMVSSGPAGGDVGSEPHQTARGARFQSSAGWLVSGLQIHQVVLLLRATSGMRIVAPLLRSLKLEQQVCCQDQRSSGFTWVSPLHPPRGSAWEQGRSRSVGGCGRSKAHGIRGAGG